MGDPAPVTSSPAKGKTQKKKVKKVPAAHPKYIDMITVAIKTLKERNGSSRQAITKYIKKNNTVPENCESFLKLALRRGVVKGVLTQVKGKGASGSFKVVDIKKPAKKTATKKKPTKGKGTKKTATKKTAAKKTAAKKTAAKKPAAKKPAAAKKTPAKKPAAKKPVAKKPAAKKVNKKKASKGKGKK